MPRSKRRTRRISINVRCKRQGIEFKEQILPSTLYPQDALVKFDDVSVSVIPSCVVFDEDFPSRQFPVETAGEKNGCSLILENKDHRHTSCSILTIHEKQIPSNVEVLRLFCSSDLCDLAAVE
jgi:hypothetical protein